MKCLVLLILILPSLGYSLATHHLGISYTSIHLFQLTSKDDASKSFLGDEHYPLFYRYHINMSGYILGIALYTDSLIMTPTAADSGSTHSIMLLSTPFIFKQSSFDWILGPGILDYTINGTGGSIVLNNGTGTSTFLLPNKTKTSRLLVAEAGVGFDLSTNYRLETSLLFSGILSERMGIHWMLNFSYGL